MTILVILICGVLFSLGGYCWNVARRYGMPILLAGAAFYLSHSLNSLWILLSIPFLCLGYGDNAPLRHIFGSCWGRGVWGLLTSLALVAPLVCFNHVYLPLAALYCTICFLAEPTLKNVYQVAGDFIIGCIFGSVVLLIHS